MPPIASAELAPRVYPIDPPPLGDGMRSASREVFAGATAGVRSWSCRATTLAPGETPHPPHAHDEEQVLLVLDGEVRLDLPGARFAGGDERLRLRRGQFVFYPPRFPHTLTAIGDRPASYLTIKWRDADTPRASPLGFTRFDASGRGPLGEKHHPWGVRQLQCAAATAHLGTLKSHVSTVAPGGSYAPHADPYDVAILTLDGEVETLGETVAPNSVIFYPAGSIHGMRNATAVPARYIVFELHSVRMVREVHPPAPPLLVRLTDPARWKRRIRQLVAR